MTFRSVIATAAVSLCLALQLSAAHANLVVIPDPAPQQYLEFDDGAGNGSVLYGGVTFSTSSAYGNGQFYNVGSLFSGDAAVLSSQQQSLGVANILIDLPSLSNSFSLDYGTFNGSAVTFEIFDGNTLLATIIQTSTGSGYLTPDIFNYTGLVTSVLVTSTDYVLNINDVGFDPVARVPEPSSLLILLTSIVIGGASYRRLKRTAKA